MTIEMISKKIDKSHLLRLAKENYGEMVKGVVDIERRILALGGELHADAESVLLEDGSRQENLWGFNIYVDKQEPERLEYSSFINIRPSFGNRAMEVQDKELRDRIKEVVDSLVG